MRAHTSVSAVDAMRRIAAGPSPIPGISLAWKPHSVSAVAFDHCVIDSQFAVRALASLVPSGASFDQLGDWLRRGPSSGSTGHLHPILLRDTRCRSGRPHPDTARRAFVTAHGDLMPDALSGRRTSGPRGSRRFLNPHRYRCGGAREPGKPLCYEQELDADRLARDVPESPAARQVTFSVITGVHARSPAEPLRGQSGP